jgi:hypothetical protein
MGNMFYFSPFNQPLNLWNVSGVTNMDFMFGNDTSFNQDLSGWCVTLIPTQPFSFATGTPSWVLPKPIWGTCPGPTPTPTNTQTPTITPTIITT